MPQYITTPVYTPTTCTFLARPLQHVYIYCGFNLQDLREYLLHPIAMHVYTLAHNYAIEVTKFNCAYNYCIDSCDAKQHRLYTHAFESLYCVYYIL